jgi:hypothetical protein
MTRPVVDGQRQPRPEPTLLRLNLRLLIDEIEVREGNSDSAWAAWDDAVLRQDLGYGAERSS